MHQVMLHETRTLQCPPRKKEMQIFIFATKLLSITPPSDYRSYEIVLQLFYQWEVPVPTRDQPVHMLKDQGKVYLKLETET